MNSLFTDLLLKNLMVYATKEIKRNPWDEYEKLLQQPSVMDKIIKVLQEESAEQKEQRAKKQRKDQRQYEKQREQEKVWHVI